MNKRTTDAKLSEIEDYCRQAGYDYPIAWALSFLVDRQRLLASALKGNTDPEVIRELGRLCHEIRTGEHD